MSANQTVETGRNLYRDFQLTFDNCHAEPIHRPTAIQSFGHLIVLNADQELHAVSDSVANLVGTTTGALWGMTVAEWFPEDVLGHISSGPSGDHGPRAIDGPVGFGGDSFEVIYYRNDGLLLLELEPPGFAEVPDRMISSCRRDFAAITTLDELYAESAQQISRAFGFDRVMVYKFDEDKHGFVVGEAKIEQLEPYLGLHYPETDIPQQARDLFLRTRSREIVDVLGVVETVHFNPALGSTPPYLDLSRSQVRAVSPIHIEYLSNMGVGASLTLAIVVEEELWGLVACHHRSPHHVSFDSRQVGEAVADLLADRILDLETSAAAMTADQSLAVETFLLEQVRVGEDYRVEVIEHAPSLIQMCRADGAALVTKEDLVFGTGLFAKGEEMVAIRDWLVEQGEDEVFSTRNLAETLPPSLMPDLEVGGLLASCVSAISGSYIFWFRHPVDHNVDWAGDPEKAVIISEAGPEGELRVSPRQSFEKWRVEVRGQSRPWETGALEMAARVRHGVFKRELQHTADLVQRQEAEFVQLAYIAAHDLMEPLRTQTNYLEVINEYIDEGVDVGELRPLVVAAESSMARMRTMLEDLLGYSQASSEVAAEVFALDDLMDEVRGELTELLGRTGATITSEELPTIRTDRSKLKQIVHNFVTNAIKYVGPNVTPEIKVSLEADGSYSRLSVRDNGIGIDPRYQDKIFKMFQRLHDKKSYSGTGLGLAICVKAAEFVPATIGVESEPGDGSTFWIRFHNSLLV